MNVASRALDAGASPTSPADGPLAWGARPTGDGPLYPVVDGMCIHGEVWHPGGTSVYSFGSHNGPWTRGAGSTAFARFTDDGLALERAFTTPADATKAEAWLRLGSVKIIGTHPNALFLFSKDGGESRMREYESIWKYGAEGWVPMASWQDPGKPSHLEPVVFAGHLVTTKLALKNERGDDIAVTTLRTWPIEKDAPPVEGLSALQFPDFRILRLTVVEKTLHAFGEISTKTGGAIAVRSLTDGKVTMAYGPSAYAYAREVGQTATALYYLVDDRLLVRFENGKFVPVSLKQPPTVALKSITVLPNGDIWALTSKNVVVVARGESITETELPKPAAPKPEEQVLHWPLTGKLLAGAEYGDPWAIGARGSVFHLVDGTWQEVELPAPPFAANGKYQAQAISLRAKGDVFVNAGYAEKGIGWRTEERYRAILRTKKPREVFRCNEPSFAQDDVPVRFTSFAPIANDACTTPFTILLRIGSGMSMKKPTYDLDPKTDYPSVREAIKATPGLGATVDLVELVAGDQRFLGAKVPNVAAGKALALEVVKKVKLGKEIRPEVVCGAPREERVLRVDVATGKVQPVTP